MSNWYVYRHIRLDKNVPFYIGVGSRAKYVRAYECSKSMRSEYWCKIVAKTDYEVEILLDGLTKEEAVKKEVEFINLYKRTKDGGTLCNLTMGGEGMSGHQMSEESKAKISQKNKGKSVPLERRERIRQTNLSKVDDEFRKKCGLSMKGRKLSKEHIEAISKKNKGRVKSEEVRKRMSMAQKGRKLSPEHIEKIVQMNTGRKHTEETKLKKSLKMRGRKGNPLTDETKEKLRQHNLGKKQSAETIEKRRLKAIGRKMSEETIERMKRAALIREANKRIKRNEKILENA